MPSDPVKEFVKKLCDSGSSVVETMERAVQQFGNKAPSMNTIYMWRRKSRGGNGERSPYYRKYSQIKKQQKFCELCNKQVSSHLYLEFHLINTHNIFMGENKRVFQYMEGMAPEELKLCVFKCDICEVELKSLESLRKHKLDEHRQRMKIPRRFGSLGIIPSMLDSQPTKSSAGSDTANSSMLNFMDDNWDEEDTKQLLSAQWEEQDEEMGDEPIMTIMKDGRIEMDDGRVDEVDEKKTTREQTELLAIKKEEREVDSDPLSPSTSAHREGGGRSSTPHRLNKISSICVEKRSRGRPPSRAKCQFCGQVMRNMVILNEHLMEQHYSDFAGMLENSAKNATSSITQGLLDGIRTEESSSSANGSGQEAPVQSGLRSQNRSETHQKAACEQDDSALFAISIAASLRLMELPSREYVKMKIQQVLYESGYAKKASFCEDAVVQSPKDNCF